MKTATIEDVRTALLWAKRVSFYAQKLAAAGLTESTPETLETFNQFPAMTADDLRNGGPDFAAAISDLSKLYSLYATGGTTGKSKLIYYSEPVLERVADATAQGIAQFITDQKGKLAIMLVPADNLAAVGEYTHRALRNLGMCVGGPGILHNDKQKQQLIGVMRDTRPHFLIGNPAQLGLLLQYAKDQQISLKEFGIQYILSTSEVLGSKTRALFEQEFGAKVYEGGGMTEVGWSTMECSARAGQHILPNVYAEVRDMTTGQLIEEGTGEFYLTTTVNEVYPLVRYKTEDVVTITHQSCACGSTAPRMWYRCRMSESVRVEEHTIYAYHVDDALRLITELSQNYSYIVRGTHETPTILFKVETEPGIRNDDLTTRTSEALRSMLGALGVPVSGLKIVVEYVDPGTLPRTPRGKIALRIGDERA